MPVAEGEVDLVLVAQVAQAALLISPLGGFTTGTNVVIDGGMTKRIQY